MAHFAELDENNVVIRVIVIDNKDTSDGNGVEKEYIGVAFCNSLFGGRWVQTSYNGNIRKRYAGTGMVYLEEHDHFAPPSPSPDHIYDSETGDWVVPGFTDSNLQVENVGDPN